MGVFVVFGVLSVRHVGDSVFLADQADQLQFFERLLRLEPRGLLGPVMSGPQPPTRTAGPLGAVLFGVPVALGFGVDAVQAVTSVLLVVTTAAAFLALASVDARFAWAWLIVSLANPILWWNAGMLWANTLMLSAGNLLLMTMALCLRRPTLARWAAVVLVVIFAAQVSLVAITAVAPAAVVLLRTWRTAWRHRPGRGAAIAIGIAAALAIGPYVLAEAMTGLENTRALLTHVTQDRPPDPAAEREIALPVLLRAADPAGVIQAAGAGGWIVVIIGAVIAAVAFGLWCFRAPAVTGAEESQNWRGDRVVLWLLVTSVIGIAGQTAFFVAESRDLLSYHYIAMLVPFYAIPPAALVAWLAARVADAARSTVGATWTREGAAIGLGAACLLLLAWRGPDLADRYWEHTDWTYTRIAGAVNALCGPGESATTLEGPGFESLMPGHDDVVKYLMTRGFLSCEYDENADAIIAASREGGYPPVLEQPDGVYQRVDVVHPGIALYRRGDP